jgi:hypothetical protein
MLVLAGCAGQAAPIATDPTLAATQGGPQGELPNCREFTARVTVEGQLRQAVGQACRQPDGSWQVALNTPGLPQQIYTLPGQAIYLYPYPEPYWDPAFYGPLFFVGGPAFLTRGFHHFHHHGGFHHGDFHGGRR